jgi:multiple sugar transport system substrate-binding protein
MRRFMFIFMLIVTLTVATLPTTSRAQDDLQLQLPETIAEGRPVTFTMDRMPGDSAPDAEKAAYQDQINRFQALYPNVTIQGISYFYGLDTFPAMLAAGEAPTILHTFFTEPKKMLQQGVSADLTEYYDRFGIRDWFNPAVLDVLTIDDKIYGFPWDAYAMHITYNNKMLQDAGITELPSTWQELAEVAQQLTDRNAGTAGFGFLTEGGAATGWHFTDIAYGLGVKPEDLIVQNEDGSYTATFGEGPAVAAMQFLYDLRWTYDVLPLDLMGGAQLNEGLVANLGMMPPPAAEDGNRYTLSGGYYALINANATEDQREAAFVFEMWSRLDLEQAIANVALDPKSIGIPSLPIYAGDYQAALDAARTPLVEDTVPVQLYEPFTSSIADGSMILVAEPDMAQEYYAAIANVVSRVLTDQSTDVAQAMREEAENLQRGILDVMQ